MRSQALETENKNASVAATAFDSNATSAKPVKESSYGMNKAAYNFGNIKVYSDNKQRANAISVQPKLKINQPGDQYEQEADAMADNVMRMPQPLFSEKKAFAQADLGVQRKCAHCEEEEKEIHRKETGESATPTVSSSVMQTLQATGQPMDNATRSFMEQRFGHDFSTVRIHNDAMAHSSSDDINALAYTHGNHVVFGAGSYQPETLTGKRLLAHELAHTLQQDKIIYREVKNVIDDKKINAAKGTEPDADDEEIIAQFAEVNKTLNDKIKLKKWIQESIENGWRPGMPVPDYRKPDIRFNDKDEAVIEAVDFRGTDGAFNTASKILPKNVGAKFWWKRRFTNVLGEYKLDYASDKGYKNLLLHEKAKDVDFDAIQKVANDPSDYQEIKAIKAYSDQLLSVAFVRLVAKAQSKLYPQNIEKQTGILDSQTAADIAVMVAADKVQADKKAAEATAKEEEQKKPEEAKPVVQTGPVHDVIKEKIAGLVTEIAAPVPYVIQAAEMASGSTLMPIPNIPAEFLYRISQHFMVGFLKHIDTLTEEEIKTKFMHLLTVQYTPGYMWGQLKGIPQGIWSWIKDMAELIWDLIKLPYTISKFMFVTLPGEMKGLFGKAEQAMEWFESNKETVYKFAKELVTGSGDDFKSIADAVKTQIYGMAQGMGASAASSLSEFAGKSNEEIGTAIGKIQGYLLPDIILAVFSQGIGNAIKGGIQSIKIFVEAGRAGAVTFKALEAGKAGVAAIEKFLEGAKIFAKEGYGKLKTMLKDILEYFKKILGLEEKGLAEAKAAGNLAEEAKALSKLETEASEVAKKDAQKYADNKVEDGPDKKSKSTILWKAVVIAQVADAQDLPITAAIAELNLLKALNPKVSFEYTGANPYEIWMIGSRYSVDPLYTATGAGLKRTRTMPQNKANEMATARGRADLELGGRTDISPENLRALGNERPVADAMAKAGYDVEFTEGRITEIERRAEGLRATANPDLRVEGKLMDIYSPSRNSNPMSAAENVFSKVRDSAGAQTRRVVVALDDSSISRTQFRDALKKVIEQYGDHGMQEIFAVQKGKVFRMYPF